jgi:hypothetical protein
MIPQAGISTKFDIFLGCFFACGKQTSNCIAVIKNSSMLLIFAAGTFL